jgi:hypothetical protein
MTRGRDTLLERLHWSWICRVLGWIRRLFAQGAPDHVKGGAMFSGYLRKPEYDSSFP